ncbi:hypothetical protein ACHAWO_004084 [Cyclotella atomus]|uniref:Uncharacterized protein n=1 Tax=Cyclotella atomus TaxID=382360 RepID=A0ABD3NMP3_9STRA
MNQNDPSADLLSWSNPVQLRPLSLQRSQTDSICTGRGRSTSEHYPAPFDTDRTRGDRRRCNTLDMEDTAACKPPDDSSAAIVQPSSPHQYPNKYINVVTPDIIESTHDLIIFEDESRVRTSTLESVMAVKSVSSEEGAQVLRSGPSPNDYMHQDVHKNEMYALREKYMEINDDRSDVSSLSDFEHQDKPSSSSMQPLTRGNTISSLFKRPMKPLRPSTLAPLIPLRLRSEARSTETATTAIHTLSTIDNFDVASPFSPLGALSGQEELSFLKSADGEQGFGSLHGYHRRCANVQQNTRHVRTNSAGHGSNASGHMRTNSDHLTTIQNFSLVPTNRLEIDLIDMEREVDQLSLIDPSSTTCPQHSYAASIGPLSVASGSSYPHQSIQNDTTMSTGDSENSFPVAKLLKPPIVSRANTSPAIFSESTSRLQRFNPAFNQRRRPPQISTGVDSPCMIGTSIAEAISPKAISFPRRPSFTNHDCGASTSMSINTKDGYGTPSLPSLEEDDENASFGSFAEELKRKDKVKMIGREMKQMLKTLDPKPVVKKGKRLLGLKVDEHDLKRADGCLT